MHSKYQLEMQIKNRQKQMDAHLEAAERLERQINEMKAELDEVLFDEKSQEYFSVVIYDNLHKRSVINASVEWALAEDFAAAVVDEFPNDIIMIASEKDF